MVSSKVAEWGACELRYVAETKLNRLDVDDLRELYKLLAARIGSSQDTGGDESNDDREKMIVKIMQLKKDLAVMRKSEAEMEIAKGIEEAARIDEAHDFASSLIDDLVETSAVVARAEVMVESVIAEAVLSEVTEANMLVPDDTGVDTEESDADTEAEAGLRSSPSCLP